MNQSRIVFDETYFHVNLKGGSTHTELIQVEGTVVAGMIEKLNQIGPQKGQGLPLKCQWFNVTKDNDFKEIEDVTGQFYQPCILDVNTKIMVQVKPILDQEYSGMPVMRETQYLPLDASISEQANKYLEQESFQVQCKLDSIHGIQYEGLQLPVDTLLTFSINTTTLFISTLSIIEEFHDYEIKIIRKTNNQIELINGNAKYHFKLQNNKERDVIYHFVKIIKGKRKVSDGQLYSQIQDYEEQIKQLKIQITQQNDEKHKLKEQQQANLTQQKKLDQQIVQQSNQLKEQQNQDKEKEKLITQLKEKMEKLEGKNQFYLQETKVLKSQLLNLESQNKKLQHEYQELQKVSNQNQDEIREMFYREKVESLRIANEKCNKENQQWQLLNEQLLKEVQDMQDQLKIAQQQRENVQNELNSFKKKYESLQQEIGQQIRERSESNISEPPIAKPEQRDDDFIEEVRRLKSTIQNLESTLKRYKQILYIKLEIQLRIRYAKGNEQQIVQEYYGYAVIIKIKANSLAETITEKDMAIDNQRIINKQLLQKIQELSK
ncbi:hypothetical protein pb186bvf_001486 [Paramecium bursaria]